MRATCSGCDASWPGSSRCHCSACHRTFSGSWAFDAHRVRDSCRQPAEVGLFDRQGTWGSPPMGDRSWLPIAGDGRRRSATNSTARAGSPQEAGR